MTDTHGHDESCDDYALSRRSLLKTTGLVGMAGVVTSMFGDVLTSTVYGASNGNVLVVLSLRGGADGMSLVVPHAEPAYYSARPTAGIAASRLLHADAMFGLHPSFEKLSGMWAAGQMAAIHAVGLPTPNRSHFDAMEVVEDADPGSSARVGWLNRMVSGLSSRSEAFAGVQLGGGVVPTSLAGPFPTIATGGFDDLRTPFAEDPVMRKRIEGHLINQYKKHGGSVGAAGVRAVALSNQSAAITAASAGGSSAQYPQSELGKALKASAVLIRSGAGVKAVAVDSGGWDQHVDVTWRVADTIKDLATCLNAFFVDLGAHADRVTVVTLSEFGRRLSENGSRGLDHGYGNAVLALGAGVNGGRFYGRWPGLGMGKQVDGDLAVTTDYRSVLMEILRARFPAVNTSKVFPGVGLAPLGFMR
ncbi:MAG: DUF1501 domain-containing protein [Aeromicrobium sp.]